MSAARAPMTAAPLAYKMPYGLSRPCRAVLTGADTGCRLRGPAPPSRAPFSGVGEPAPAPADRGQRGMRQIGGDGFFEPRVVPPPRPHQAAEPQMGHLMRADHRAALV